MVEHLSLDELNGGLAEILRSPQDHGVLRAIVIRQFKERFGVDALKFVNSTEGKQLHLRGVYARIVQAGMIRVGDEISKV